MKNYRYLFPVIAIILCALMIGCSARAKETEKEEVAERGTGLNAEMNPVHLQYLPFNRYWTKNGTELVVEGAFCNLSSDYDVVGMEEAYINLIDLDGNVVYVVNVNEDFVRLIPHNGSFPYNFTVSKIPGGAQSYRASELIPKVEATFYYAEHLAVNCPNCIDAIPQEVAASSTLDCDFCGGDGYVVCPDCKGSGKMDEMFQGVLRAMNHGRCQRCDGSGQVYCDVCYGKGYID